MLEKAVPGCCALLAAWQRLWRELAVLCVAQPAGLRAGPLQPASQHSVRCSPGLWILICSMLCCAHLLWCTLRLLVVALVGTVCALWLTAVHPGRLQLQASFCIAGTRLMLLLQLFWAYRWHAQLPLWCRLLVRALAMVVQAALGVLAQVVLQSRLQLLQALLVLQAGLAVVLPAGSARASSRLSKGLCLQHELTCWCLKARQTKLIQRSLPVSQDERAMLLLGAIDSSTGADLVPASCSRLSRRLSIRASRSASLAASRAAAMARSCARRPPGSACAALLARACSWLCTSSSRLRPIAITSCCLSITCTKVGFVDCAAGERH